MSSEVSPSNSLAATRCGKIYASDIHDLNLHKTCIEKIVTFILFIYYIENIIIDCSLRNYVYSSITLVPSDDKETFLYFAYGSNLLERRIHMYNPSAIFVTNGRLDVRFVPILFTFYF